MQTKNILFWIVNLKSQKQKVEKISKYGAKKLEKF